jgi:hypothetical protein
MTTVLPKPIFNNDCSILMPSFTLNNYIKISNG